MNLSFTTLLLIAVSGALQAANLPAPGQDFVKSHCAECHDAETKKGGLDLTSLVFDPANADAFEKWVRVHDRVQSGEMPPKKKARPEGGAMAAFLKQLAAQLTETDARQQSELGRVRARRLTRFEHMCKHLRFSRRQDWQLAPRRCAGRSCPTRGWRPPRLVSY